MKPTLLWLISMPGGAIPPKLPLHYYQRIGRWGGDLDRYSSMDLFLRLLALAIFSAMLLVLVSM
jgi:hypothetical protein